VKSKVLFWTVIVAAFLLLFIFYDPHIMPFPKCPFRSITGFQCPGCGSQRAIYHVLHGNFAESFRLNYLFLPALFYGLTGWVTATILPSRWPGIKKRFYGLEAAYIALVVILLFWIGRNI
jgi:hypothetical protein